MPFESSKKNGYFRGMQRYRCLDCKHVFNNKRRDFTYSWAAFHSTTNSLEGINGSQKSELIAHQDIRTSRRWKLTDYMLTK